MINCDVCGKEFYNRYALSNHFLNRGNSKYLDKDHEDYFLKHIKKTKIDRIINCKKCGKEFKAEGAQKKCFDCRNIKRGVFGTKDIACCNCGKQIKAAICAVHKACDDCKKKKKEIIRLNILNTPKMAKCCKCGDDVVIYKKKMCDRLGHIVCNKCKSDKHWFKKHPQYDEVINLIKNDDLLTRYKIVEMLNINVDFIKEAAIDKFGIEWYQNRLKKIWSRASGYRIGRFYQKLRKNPEKFKKFFENRNNKRSSLEDLFISKLQKNVKTENNSWITVDVFNQKECHEIDIKVVLPKTNRKFAILIDGEAFHGKNAVKCFNTPSIEKDEEIAKVLANLGYYSIRYSGNEVKSGDANNHFDKLYKQFQNNKPYYYYRNWMTKEELLKGEKHVIR